MDGKILFSNADIKVSREHLSIHGQTFAISDITSAELNFIEPKRILATVLFLAGLFLLLDEGKLFALGGFSIILGVVFWVSGVTKYALVIDSAAGKKQVFTINDRLLAEKIMHAVDTAMLENMNPKVVKSFSIAEISYRENNNDVNFGAS